MFQDTFAQFRNCCRSHEIEGKCYSTLSGRSSQVNSHSNTESACSRQSSLRFLEADLASRRPLIVSFRRPNYLHESRSPTTSYVSTKRARHKYSNDPDIQLENLEELRESRYLDKLNVITNIQTFSDLCDAPDFNSPCYNNGKCFSCNDYSRSNLGVSMNPESLIRINDSSKKNKRNHTKSPKELFDGSPETTLSRFSSKVDLNSEYRENDTESKTSNCFAESFASDFYDHSGFEMQNLQPTHICPHRMKRCDDRQNKKRKHRHHHHTHKVAETNRPIPKSCTFTSIDPVKSGRCNGNNSDKTLSVPTIPGTERRNSFSCLRIDSSKTDSNSILLVRSS